MKKWSLNTKILSILSIFIIGSVAIAVTGIMGMNNIKSALDDIVNVNSVRVGHVYEIKNLFLSQAINEKSYILAETKEGKAEFKERMDNYNKQLIAAVEAYTTLATERGKKNISEFKAVYDKWEGTNAEVIRLSLAGKEKEAFALSSVQGRDERKKAEEIIDSIVVLNKDIMKQESENAHALYTELKTMMIAISIGAIFAGLAIAFFVMRTVNGAIDQVIGNLTDSSSQVTSAAYQIASSSEQLSGAVTEQAASLEQTAASVEELNSMVHKNAENAMKTSRLAESSAASATKGKEVVQDMVHAIDDINTSNNSIMESINESNRKIAEIVTVITEIGTKTKVINDIVFQTKLLSFNASVEAARAGEQGKGFAVVAEEIGNLAQMSGNSAKEITMMLDSSIEKVQGIVAETKTKVERLIKEGKLKVEAGTKIAHDCDRVLSEIVENVSSVTAMAGEISNACQEQALGVQEITKAMGQLDQVTQNNSATSEETASAAGQLSAQAESLRSVVGILVQTIKGENADVGYVAPIQQKNNVVPLKKKTIARAAMPSMHKKVSGSDIYGIPKEDDSRFEDI